ncbi:choline-phosphate cytidylyltransferase [Malassezia yamatoensis]|uniref:choline-phosphate cytidylyltransferase n=1 Tax=Malassezia yamatoensis TaxID=253288 RepID=A0AAJ5YRK3_9BASI|nr:choline-phosphate cytidylyltransferase [Malassezia yamatoensis]
MSSNALSQTNRVESQSNDKSTCANDEPATREVSTQSYDVLMGAPSSKEQRPPFTSKAPIADIRSWVHNAIFSPAPERPYRINYPPKDRPVRIYADGVYDLFHYAHMLQLRQAKLSFPNVYLIVGVVSSELCEKHKNRPMLDSDERYEAVRNCRWVDEVLEDAPWVIEQPLLEKLNIDYVAHDELPYAMATAGQTQSNSDVYDWLKKRGMFLPTRRTEGVSTSDLMARIVTMYRDGDLDAKLERMGDSEITSKVHIP